ncbi:MAG: hypothetical protein AAF810_18460 [Cyanobacteria bacterium P01_D01_bin.36]
MIDTVSLTLKWRTTMFDASTPDNNCNQIIDQLPIIKQLAEATHKL